MKINETYDFFCVNCGEITRQTYRGIYADGNHLYICKECGCENTEAKGGLNMDNKEIEIIKSMVIHGCCKVCFVNGYDSTVLNKFTSEINQLFDNFIENKITAIESKGETE